MRTWLRGTCESGRMSQRAGDAVEELGIRHSVPVRCPVSVSSVNANLFSSSTAASSSTSGVQSHLGRHRMDTKVLSAVADKLGMSADDLKTQLSSGKSLADVATSKGLSRQDLISTIKSALTSTAATGISGTPTASNTPSLDDIANKIADKVHGNHHHHHAGATTPTPSSTPTTTSTTTQLLGLGSTLDTTT